MADLDNTHLQTPHDYSRPASFEARLSKPLDENLKELIPLAATGSSFSEGNGQVNGRASTVNPSSNGEADIEVPFMVAMDTIGDALTENGAVAHSKTKSAVVDLFYEFTPGVQATRLYDLLDKAWREDSTAALKIIFHARSIHEGKGIEEESFRALSWLYEHHPHTFLSNLHLLVEPTCKKDRSKARDEAKARRAAERILKEGKVVALDEVGDVDIEEEEVQEYPPRPHGCFKDLITILMLAVNGQFGSDYTGRLSAIKEAIAPASQAKAFKRDRVPRKNRPDLPKDHSKYGKIAKDVMYAKRASGEIPLEREVVGGGGRQAKKAKKDKGDVPLEIQLLNCKDKRARHVLMHDRLITKLEGDNKFQALYLAVLDIFVKTLRDDLARLEEHKKFLEKSKDERKPYKDGSSPHLFGMSFAAKWAPTPGSGPDHQLHFAQALTKALFPKADDYFYGRTLQREVLTPIRAVQTVVETKMVQGDWKIDYTKVAGRAMRRYAKLFQAHDLTGFAKYMGSVAKGFSTISGASRFPHEMLQDIVHQDNPILKQLADLQWATLVDSLRSSSNARLTNSIAIADVSGSMGSFTYLRGGAAQPQPLEVCIALTLLLGELAASPWNGAFFTFSSQPTLERIDPALALSERIQTLQQAHWEMSTAFDKVFDLILETAKREKLAPERIVQKLFVLSDMQFDVAGGARFGETVHQTISRKFTEAGYVMPTLVYWNLAQRCPASEISTKPVQADTEGTEMVSGYSGALMKYFLGQQAEEDEAVWEEKEEDEFDRAGEEMVMLDMEGNEKVQQEAEKVEKVKEMKKRPTPLETVKRIISKECFAGVKVVD